MGTFRVYDEQIQESDCEQGVEERTIVNSEAKAREVGTHFHGGASSSSKAPDTCSIASSSSLSSSTSASSSASVMIDPGKKQHLAGAPVKVLGPANDNQNRTQPQCHSRIRRVPSTANPKYKVPKLGKQQRSHSQPQLQFHSIQSQRRNSSPSTLPFKQQTSSAPDLQSIPMGYPHPAPVQTQHSKQGDQQQQQQVIYLQIPQPSQSQMYDPQALQHQISSQLQLLVPQIYSQLLSKISVGSPVKSSESSNDHQPIVHQDSTYVTNEVQSQRVLNQIYDQSSKVEQKGQQSSNNIKRQHKSSGSQTKDQSTNNNSTQISAEDISKYLQIENISQILQQIPAHILQENLSSQQTSYIEIQQMPGFPKITIPITQELLLQCQQFHQNRDLGFIPYQPRLETILEESLSVKHLKMTKSPKTKIIACILTVLCVVVVVLLAGDKTVAVVVVAVVFIVFLLASIFYLYVNSSKSHMTPALAHSDSQRIQVSTISTCDKPSSMV